MTSSGRIHAVLGEKLGMTQLWDENGRVVPVTVVKAGPCVVTQVRTPATDGYSAVQIAYGAVDPRKVTKPVGGQFARAGVPPRKHLTEIRTDDASEYTLGTEVTVAAFSVGERVDIVGRSKGKGFAGVMKRHGFHGMGASHGDEAVHRKSGSIGGAATPARVFKGKKMAGRMGNVRTTTHNLLVQHVDADQNLLYVRGAVPGSNGSLVLVRTGSKKAPLSAGGQS